MNTKTMICLLAILCCAFAHTITFDFLTDQLKDVGAILDVKEDYAYRLTKLEISTQNECDTATECDKLKLKAFYDTADDKMLETASTECEYNLQDAPFSIMEDTCFNK